MALLWSRYEASQTVRVAARVEFVVVNKVLLIFIWNNGSTAGIAAKQGGFVEVLYNEVKRGCEIDVGEFRRYALYNLTFCAVHNNKRIDGFLMKKQCYVMHV